MNWVYPEQQQTRQSHSMNVHILYVKSYLYCTDSFTLNSCLEEISGFLLINVTLMSRTTATLELLYGLPNCVKNPLIHMKISKKQFFSEQLNLHVCASPHSRKITFILKHVVVFRHSCFKMILCLACWKHICDKNVCYKTTQMNLNASHNKRTTDQGVLLSQLIHVFEKYFQ